MTKKIARKFAPWETTAKDGIEEEYVCFDEFFMLHKSTLSLSPAALRTLTYMRLEGDSECVFEMPYDMCKQWISEPAFFKALDELVAKGFIDIKEKGAGTPSVYSFSSRWKDYKGK